MSQELPPVSGPLKILSITAQKPHSTGSGVYLTELVQAFHRKGCRQAGMILYASQTAFLFIPFITSQSSFPFPSAECPMKCPTKARGTRI